MIDHYVYGIHAVKALLTNRQRKVNALFVRQERTDDSIKDLLDLAKERQIIVEYLSEAALTQRFTNTVVHQGVIASATPLPQYHEHDISRLLEQSKKPSLILILDGITDPHNLGACLRSADAAAVSFVIIPKDKNASITPVVSKVACGAAESVPLVTVTNLARSMELLKEKGIWIYGADGSANQSLYAIDCSASIALVMGAEGSGMRRLTRKICDQLFALPMQGTVSSLNVSVAAGICLYEVVRQRLPG
ncbi:MAG: 23S rRNA (guanosine(2251)-2'-O)-methyltransferase RlmB [Legionella sp.]